MRRLAALAVLAATLGAPAAAGAHHSIFIREVRASAITPMAGFVELQAYRQGQNAIAPSSIDVYSPTGAKQSFLLLTDAPNAQNQRTMLIGDSAVAGADFALTGLGSAMAPGAGAVCLPEATPTDCVTWGAFATPLPFPGGGPAAPAIAEGLSLTRTIARGCPLGLDGADDTNSSAADFALGSPTPTPNSVPAVDRECVPCGGSTATIVGTDSRDVLRGTAGRDVIAAGAGADVVRGIGGNDLLCGGIGKDVLRGGKGRDRLLGGRGNDRCLAGDADAVRSCERR